jgi:hypothetical protein
MGSPGDEAPETLRRQAQKKSPAEAGGVCLGERIFRSKTEKPPRPFLVAGGPFNLCYAVSRAGAQENPIWPAWFFLDQKDAAIVLIDELLRKIFANEIVVLSVTEQESTSRLAASER